MKRVIIQKLEHLPDGPMAMEKMKGIPYRRDQWLGQNPKRKGKKAFEFADGPSGPLADGSWPRSAGKKKRIIAHVSEIIPVAAFIDKFCLRKLIILL